jgi:predicted dehydrogenase
MTPRPDATWRTRPEHPRLAVVGLGYWGPKIARNIQELECAELAAVCDASEQALADVARRYPGARATSSFDEILEDPTIDGVVIATPIGTHYALAAAALRADKHVFVEKPLAASTEESAQLIALADERGLVLMPGHTFLYSPPVLMIRDLIASGELGDIYFVSMSRVNLGLHQSDVSVAWDLGPHDFSILRFWLGETPDSISALSRACVIPGMPDVAFINMEFPSQTIAHVELSWLAPSKLRRTTIVGASKMVVYDDTSNEPVRIFDSGVSFPNPDSFGEFRLSYRTGDIVSPPVSASEPLGAEMEDFCRAVTTGSTPVSSAALGHEVVRMIESTDVSLARQGARVEIDPRDAIALAG